MKGDKITEAVIEIKKERESNHRISKLPGPVVKNIDIFVCPGCNHDVRVSDDGCSLECPACHHTFECPEGIPHLFWLDESDPRTAVTKTVKSFYEENPFPGYEDIDSILTFKEKAERGIFARLLDEQVPHGSRILEVGCGTGQLSNFLAITWGRTVFATDISLNSLRLGQEFKEKNQIDNVSFIQMNLFHPVFKANSFNLVICNGVLHHTKDPFLGFKKLRDLVKQGGFIIIGLYNKFGRIPNDIRRFLFRISGNRLKFLDPRLRNEQLSGPRKYIWFRDQYENPQESKHTFAEVLSWFDQCGICFLNSIPKAGAFETFSPEEKLFQPHPRGTKLDHFLVQLWMLISGGQEGGFFLMIGRKEN